MSNFPETLGLGQIISRELKEEIERRYNTYVELERQLAAKQAKIDAAVAACKIKDDAFNKLMMLPNKYPGHREIAATSIIAEALAVTPSQTGRIINLPPEQLG